eukprot:5579993-Alexandrium_andersonii.AAC.1
MQEFLQAERRADLRYEDARGFYDRFFLEDEGERPKELLVEVLDYYARRAEQRPPRSENDHNDLTEYSRATVATSSS